MSGPYPAYQYRSIGPTDLIRLLVLKPALETYSELRCSIEHVGNICYYEAVSYAWGPQVFCDTLIVEESEMSSRIRVTASVAGFLRKFRKRDTRRFLWVDAICINQKDPSEKSMQVLYMPRIFSKAECVLVWLGDDVVRTSLGLEIDNAFEVLQRDCSPDLNSNGPVDLILRLLQKPWFGRRWVVQEVVLAAQGEVHCAGWRCVMDLNLFLYRISKFISTFSAHFETTERTSEMLDAIVRLRPPFEANHNSKGFLFEHERDTHDCAIYPEPSRKKPTGFVNTGLLYLLHHFHSTECAGLRDRVYALLGMIQDPFKHNLPEDNWNLSINVNYNENYVSSYIRIAQEIVCSGTDQAFGLLHCAGAFSGRSPETFSMLSWVPDWSSPRKHKSFLRQRWEEMPLTSRGHAFLQLSDDRLSVQGYGVIFCPVTSVCNTYLPISAEVSALKRVLLTWWLFIIRSKSFFDILRQAGFSALLLEILARTVTANQLSCISRSERGQAIPGEMENFCQVLAIWFMQAERALMDPAITNEDAFWKAVLGSSNERMPAAAQPAFYKFRQTMEGRSFFIVKDEYMGICPNSTREGDVVAGFEGESSPFILRPCDHRRDYSMTARLIGDCYIDGVTGEQIAKRTSVPFTKLRII